MISTINYSLFICLVLFLCLGLNDGGFNNVPGTVKIHENHDDVYVVWQNIDATCDATYDCSYHCESYPPCYNDCYESYDDSLGRSICKRICSDDTCHECSVSNNNNHWFEMNEKSVVKKECAVRGCNYCTASGCLNAGDEYDVKVTCNNTAYPTEISTTVKVIITGNSQPEISFLEGDDIEVTKDKPVNYVINQVMCNYSVYHPDSDSLTYTLQSGPSLSYIHGNKLFNLNTDDGSIYVEKTLTMEFSSNYTMVLCISDRRSGDICKTLNIRLVACYQTPNCSDHDIGIADTFGITPHSSTDSLYNVTSPDPDAHFKAFRETWEKLTWTYVSNELGDKTSLHELTGEIRVIQNISIHPAWPSKTFTQVVSVQNSESCYTATCTIRVTVDYTNWPIEIRNLPEFENVSEDADDQKELLVLDIYDYNDADEDNVTCNITNISPDEDNLFFLESDDMHKRSSYTLIRLECQTKNCGYKNDSFLCQQNIGCLNHNLTQQYDVTIRCIDAYGSEDIDVFTLYVVKNEAPVYVNLPNTVILDTSVVASLDTVFSIMYTDNEKEILIYDYIFADDDDPSVDPGYFIGSPGGNFTDNLANITTTVHLHDKPVNKTYTAEICGHERRNIRCEYLTVKLQEYCSPAPNCSDKSITIDENEPNDELFDMAQLVSQTSPRLSYAISSLYPNKFTVDTSTGKVTKIGDLEAAYRSSTYVINAFVSEPDTCSYGHCVLIVHVNYVNKPISITNLPERISIHEDDTSTITVYAIETSDDNTDDSVSCVLEDSLEPFYITETIAGSQEFIINKREGSVLSSATTTYSISVNCSDDHGSSDSAILTITVELNQGPVFNNLNGSTPININPYDYTEGDSIYIVSATDPENDALIFSCSVSNSMVPLRCRTKTIYTYIELRRNVYGDRENGETYTINLCVSDEKHDDHSCGSLEVTITSTKTRPEISNIPGNLPLPEDTTVGTVLFSAVVVDPDLDESHSFSMIVIPRDEQSIFYMNSNGDILLLGTMDYERVRRYELIIGVSDGYLEAEEVKFLIIDVENVNEANSLVAEKTTISFQETTEENTVLEDPGLTCTDEDDDDTLLYSIDSFYSHFSINNITGELSLIKEWDLESDEMLPTTTTIIISCTDTGGLSSTVAITVNIEPVNEHSPQLHVLSGDLTIQVNCSTDPATVLLTVHVTDDDYNDDNVFQASILGSGLGNRYFRIVSSSGADFSLRPRGYFYFDNDKTFHFSIKVCDGEDIQRCRVLTIKVHYTCYIVNDSVPEKKCITCTNNGRAIVASLVIEGLIVFGFIAHAYTSMVYGKSKNKTEAKIDSIKQKLRQGSSTQRNGRNVFNERFNRGRPGSNRSVATTRGVMVSMGAPVTKPEHHDVDLSSGSSDDSDDDMTEFRRRTQSVSSRLSVLSTSNKVHPSRTSSIESVLDVPKKIFRPRAQAGTSRLSADTGLPQPIYSNSVDGNSLDF